MPREITDIEQSDKTLRLTYFAVDHCSTAIYWHRSDGKVLYANWAACGQLGYSREEMRRLAVSDIEAGWPPDYWPTGWQKVKQNGVWNFESHHRRKDGYVFPVEVTMNFVKRGGEEYVFAFVIDITERKRAEETLRLTQYAVDHCSTPIAWIKSNGQIFYANKAECQLLGYSQDELQGLSVWDVDPNYPADSWTENWHKFKEAGVSTFESRQRRKDGHIFPTEITTNYMERNGEEYLFAFVTDITSRKQTEGELRDSETRLHAIFDHHYQLTGLLDCQGRLLAANKTALKFSGADETEVIGQYFSETPWWDPSQKPRIRKAIERAAQGEFVRFECTHTRADGEVRNFDFSLSPVYRRDGSVIYLVPEGRDVTELKRAEDELRQHDAMLRALVETSRDRIWSIDLHGNHTYCNPAVEEILGYRADELIGKPCFALIHEEDQEAAQIELRKKIAERRGWNGWVLRWGHKNGSWRYLESNAVPILGAAGELLGFRGVDRDITDRLEAEEKLAGMKAHLAHVARLSAMGQMAAGIAHEVGQPLYAIGNYARATRNALAAGKQMSMSDLGEWNEAIAESAERGAEIVRRMRTFARCGESERSPCCLNDIVHESSQLVTFDARTCGAVVNLDLPDQSPCVNVVRVEIQQVLVNLLRNAFESMCDSEHRARAVTIRVEPADEFVRVSVTDTGMGLAANIEQDIFEPFTTSKKNGLGLGLAISSSIIEAHDGELWFEPAQGSGATFRFTLPALVEEHDRGD